MSLNPSGVPDFRACLSCRQDRGHRRSRVLSSKMASKAVSATLAIAGSCSPRRGFAAWNNCCRHRHRLRLQRQSRLANIQQRRTGRCPGTGSMSSGRRQRNRWRSFRRVRAGSGEYSDRKGSLVQPDQTLRRHRGSRWLPDKVRLHRRFPPCSQTDGSGRTSPDVRPVRLHHFPLLRRSKRCPKPRRGRYLRVFERTAPCEWGDAFKPLTVRLTPDKPGGFVGHIVNRAEPQKDIADFVPKLMISL